MKMSKIMNFQDFAILSDGMVQTRGATKMQNVFLVVFVQPVLYQLPYGFLFFAGPISPIFSSNIILALEDSLLALYEKVVWRRSGCKLEGLGGSRGTPRAYEDTLTIFYRIWFHKTSKTLYIPTLPEFLSTWNGSQFCFLCPWSPQIFFIFDLNMTNSYFQVRNSKNSRQHVPTTFPNDICRS